MAVTLKTIADELGLHVSVVSRALNRKPDSNAVVAEATKARVLETAARLRYRPNRMAEFMKRGHGAAIGVFLPDIPNRLVADLMIGISVSAARHGFPLNFFFGRDGEDYRRFLNRVDCAEHSGILTYPFRHSITAAIAGEIAAYRERGGKILVLNAAEAEPGIPVLRIDDECGVRGAAEILLARGCGEFITEGTYPKRSDIFRAEIARHGLPVTCIDLRSPQAALQEIYGRCQGRIGVFATSDACALRLFPLLQAQGAVIGADTLVVGFDDLYLTNLTTPALTTIHQPFRELGEQAVTALIGMMYGENVAGSAIAPWPVLRESTGDYERK